MTDLRAQVVEAMAKAIGDATGMDWENYYLEATVALDAALDAFVTQQEAWFAGKRGSPRPLSVDCIDELLAALRDSEKETPDG